jgi:thioredoxin-like negative regulator of GroEL
MAGKEENAAVVFAKVDVDEAEDVAASQKIQAMPTFKLFKDGKEIAVMMGADLEKLTALVAQHK